MVQTPDKPLVSVVTATFNALPELKMTIPNIAGQDFRSVEHIIIDGGSSDGTAEYLAGLGGAVRWLSEPDGGIGDALNKGIAMARGEYVLVLQAEDRFCDPGSLRAAAAELAGGEDIVAFEVDLLFADGSVRRRRSRPFGWLTRFKMTSPHQGMFCRRDLFSRIGAFDPEFRIAMDYEFLLRAMQRGAQLKAVPWPVAVMPATGISTQADWPSIRARLAEDRRLQRRHAAGFASRLMTEAFWVVYMPFKYMKARLCHG
ncbi:MAG: glycosyltransferase family 2 protein [Novosphingobium sp.]